jgi:hypothetical protein
MRSTLRILAAALFCTLPYSLPVPLLFPLASCAGTPPAQLAMPGPKLRNGVMVEITSLVGVLTRPLGFDGWVENMTRDSIPRFTVRLDGVGHQGRMVGRATAEILDLAPGERRPFRAKFPLPTPDGLREVLTR